MPEDIDPSAPDLQIDPKDKRIDVGAKFALQRMLKVPATAVDAARLIRGINGGTLAGIFGDDLAAAVKVAQAHGTQRWLLVPKGEDAALVLDASAPLDAPPTIIFRGDTPDIRNKPSRLDPALKKASQTFALFQNEEIGDCDSDAAATPVSNLVPQSFCQLPPIIRSSVWIRLELPAVDAPNRSDRIQLVATGRPYFQERVVGTDHQQDLSGDHVDIEFTGTPVEGVFTATIVPPDGPPYVLFEQVPFAELNTLAGDTDEQAPAADDIQPQLVSGLDTEPGTILV